MNRFGLNPFEARSLDFFYDFFNNRTRQIPEENNFVKLQVDLEDNGDHFLLTADLPGFTQDDIEVLLEDDILTIEANHSEEKEINEKKYICKERRCGSYSRKFNVSGIKSEDIKGKFENGVLYLELPKQDGEAKTSRRIELQGPSEEK